MASIAAVLIILTVAAAPAVNGVQYIVGGSSKWSQSTNYDAWSAAQKFTVGDTLLFQYDGSHKVDEVNEADYNSCSFANPIQSHDDGNTSIALTKAGPMYFVCPVSSHCANGMKLKITVTASTSGPTGSPPPPSGSTTPNTPPTTPSNTVSPPPPPPSSGSPSIVCNMNMLGLTALLAPLLAAFMG
ncbi:hypothetical protein FNV43_RR10768 [Rhamnella rubrinervis]|uniref:Phytocyanin domain-containing protein n=1 Tax=Rhamnella rubrinervis TaxID=2594499 RepID=A0A8K0H4D9_9ROSA|nr:hypothetical protein FNV43_RR10768 [Rhamnella rubrinervis]